MGDDRVYPGRRHPHPLAGKAVREWTRGDTVDVSCPDCWFTGHDRDAPHCKACGQVIYQEFDGRD